MKSSGDTHLSNRWLTISSKFNSLNRSESSKITPGILTIKEKTVKSYRKELSFNIPSRRGFLNITPNVETALRESGIREGFVLINRNHITAC